MANPNVFALYVQTDNAAFDPDPRQELARILRHVADRIEANPERDLHWYSTILDVNGNDVGRFAIKPGETVAPMRWDHRGKLVPSDR